MSFEYADFVVPFKGRAYFDVLLRGCEQDRDVALTSPLTYSSFNRYKRVPTKITCIPYAKGTYELPCYRITNCDSRWG